MFFYRFPLKQHKAGNHTCDRICVVCDQPRTYLLCKFVRSGRNMHEKVSEEKRRKNAREQFYTCLDIDVSVPLKITNVEFCAICDLSVQRNPNVQN